MKALGEFFALFREKSEPLSEWLAPVLNDRLRPLCEIIILLTCDKLQLPNNVPDLYVLTTNNALSKALSTGGNLLDTWLYHI